MGRPRSWKWMSFTAARRLACRVGFTRKDDYTRRHKQFGLPPNPRYSFPDVFRGWPDYLGVEPRGNARKFVSYGRAKQIVREHGITNQVEYNNLRRAEPSLGLPWVPQKVYSEWTCWSDFHGQNSLNHLSNEQRHAEKCRKGRT